MVPESLTRIGYLTNEIFKHISYNEDEQGISNIYSIILKIFYITECQGDEIKHLQELKKNFTKTKKITTDNIKKIKNSSLTSYREILSNDITSLRKIIHKHNLSESNTESFFIYKNDHKMQVEIEMLTLSILSSIEHSNLFLITTQLSNEEGPLLVGRYLRNYLAHGNAVVDVLMDSTQSLFLFALKIIKHDIYRKGNFKIKIIKNLSNAKSIVENQESLFCALSNGSLANVKHWMKEGADIYGREPDKKTALHFASKSSNINIIKLLIDRGLNPKTKDVNDTNILHIATASGCKDAVSYIIEDLEISVDEKFNYNQTALHIAAENGFFDVVEILLHHKATINVGQFHETPLYKAVINDKAKTADLLLQNVQDINSIRHATGKTLLHVAADLGLKNMVEYLLSKGADVNSVSDIRVTPLHKSAYAGHVDIVTLLISNGAIVNAKDSADNIPLHFAAFNGQSSTAEVLLKHGADFNAFNKEKLSPLQRAILNGHLNVLKSFIEHGASTEDLERRGFPVFKYAIRHNNLELINILIENGMSINIRDPDGCTPLHQSIKNGSIDISLRLIECGADINSADKFNLTPLSLSIKLGYFEIVDKLLSEQANIHSVDYKGQTLLHMCVLNFKIMDSMGEEYFTETYNDLVSNLSRFDIFKKLVERGISIERENIFGRTPLHLACISGYDDIVRYLIPKLVDINVSDKMGYTPLHHAVKNNNLKVIDMLLASKECRLDFRTFKNETALCLAATNNYTESTRLLIKYGADVNDGDPLHEALMRGYQDMCIILLEKKSTNIEKQFKDKSKTLLWYAVNKGLKRVVSCVLEKKKLSTSDDLNELLYFAIQGGYDDIVTILLNHGADVNFVFKPNCSPLHLAVFYGHSDIIKLLLARGADFNKLNSDNRRPVDLAVFLGHLESAQIFFQKQIIDINEKIHGASTLLNLAAECGHLDLLKFLTNGGADLNVIGSFGSKPIHTAAQMGQLHIVKYFIQRDEKLLTDRGSANMTLLHYAACGGQTAIVKYLIEKGIDVNDECDDGFRPIHFAIKFNHEELIKVLLNYGAFYDCIRLYQIENKDIKGILLMTKELFHSVICNNISKVISLVDEGACINAKDSTDSTVLHYAARRGHAEITQILVKNNANPNIFGEKNATPLHYASVYGRIEVVIILLENGAIYDAITTDKKTPLDLSSSESVSDLLKLIDSAFKSVQNANIEILNTLAKIMYSDVLKSIMCTKNKRGKTLLSCAIDNDFPEIKHLQQLFFLYSETYNQIYNHLFIKENFYDHISKQTKSLQKISPTHVSDNPDSLETKENSAIILYKQEKYQEALDIFQEMLQRKIKIFGLGNIRTQKTRFYIGSILHRLDRNEEAIEILEDVYLQQSILIGLDHFETLITLCSMPVVLNELKRYDDALNQNSIMLEKFLEMFGLENPLTIHSLELRADILTETDKYGEALSCCKCVYEYKRRELGPSHPDTLMSLFKVKSLLYYQSSSDKALNDLQDFLKIQENVLGPNHRYTLMAEYELAKLSFKCHRFSEGYKIAKRYVAKLKAISGENDSKVLKMEQDLEKMEDGVDIFNLLTSKYKASKPSASLMQDMYQFETFDSEGTTFLHFVAREGHTSLVNYALRVGFNVMVVTNTGNTALHVAASEGHTEIIELLLMHVKETNFKQLTAFINARTRNSRNSALHAAADVETVKTLLMYGAIYNIRNKDGKTPKECATVDSISDFLQLIEEFFIGALIGDGKITSKFKKLCPTDKLAVLNARNELHHTILQVAENYGYKEIIKTIELQLQLEIFFSKIVKTLMLPKC
nr:uncharacterized protein LOC107444287 [Parasteatoda tepidariorum]